jgi:hypothetical protein
MTDPTVHPGTDEICDLDEGLLTPEDTTRIHAHLRDCADCTELRTSLQGLPELLREATAEPMPAAVWLAIDSALAAESQRRTVETQNTAETQDTAGARNTEQPAVSRETAPLPAQRTRPTGRQEPAGSGPGRSERRRRLLTRAVLGAAALALFGGGTFLVTQGDLGQGGANDAASGSGKQSMSKEHEAQGKKAAPSAPPSGRARAEYTDQNLGPEARRVVAGLAPSGGPPAAATRPSPSGSEQPEQPKADDGAGGGDLDSRRGRAAQVPSCARRLMAQHGTPLGSEPGSYRGRAVALFAFADPKDTSRMTVYLVNADCTERPADVILRRSIPR